MLVVASTFENVALVGELQGLIRGFEDAERYRLLLGRMVLNMLSLHKISYGRRLRKRDISRVKIVSLGRTLQSYQCILGAAGAFSSAYLSGKAFN